MLQCSKWRQFNANPYKDQRMSTLPLAILTELAVEGTSSLVEAQRALLSLAQQENDIILNGVKERVGGFRAGSCDDRSCAAQPRHSSRDAARIADHHQQANAAVAGVGKGRARASAAPSLVEFAREGVETFTRAQKKFLDVVAQETAKATSGKHVHEAKATKKTELAHLAREAGNAFIEAQKRLLDVMGQQMNVNLDATTRTLELMSPARLVPMANLTGEGVKNFVDDGNIPDRVAHQAAKEGCRRGKVEAGQFVAKAAVA